MARKPEVQYVYYTDGSAARQMEPAILPFPVKNPARKRRAQQQVQQQEVVEIEVLPIVCIALSVVLIAVMIFGMQQLESAYEMEAKLEKYVLELEQTNEARRLEYENSIDLEAVEQKAIALGLVPVDQVRHITIRIDAPEVVEEQSFVEEMISFFADIFA